MPPSYSLLFPDEMSRNPVLGNMGTGPRSHNSVFFYSLISVFYCFSLFCNGANSITQGQMIRDGDTITSPSQKFVLGFFSPENSVSRYVGIWHNVTPVQSVVWVANRESPVTSKFGILTVGNSGNLMVLDGYGNSLWSTNSSAVAGQPRNSTSTVILMDTGNLILSISESVGGQGGKAIWQSFNNPTDTFLPDMKVYIDVQSDENRVFTSWKSENDPSIGQYSMGIDPRGSPQIVIWDGSNRHWRSGHWNGIVFTGVPTMGALYSCGFKLIKESGTFYFTYALQSASDLVRFRIRSDGIEEQLKWDEGSVGNIWCEFWIIDFGRSKWSMVQLQPSNDCEVYNWCGAFGICNVMEKPICSCMKGFVPKNESEWEGGTWLGGCVRRTNLGCGNISSSSTNTSTDQNGVAEGESVDGFLKIEGVKLPDFASLVMTAKIDECRQNCLKNCSCYAYAFVSGINCMVWSGNLVDMQHFPDGGNDLYIRVAHSELGNKRRISKPMIILVTVIGTFFISVSIWILWRFKTKSKRGISSTLIPTIGSRSRESTTDFSGSNELGIEGQQRNGQELSLYSFSYVAAATNNFSDENKLGQGGLGPVYKGKLPGREEIAVKRLSRKSGQGLEEFKNEIILIKKLQHRNLVRILGCCIEGEERMLLYEYMPNKSLDKFLFDKTMQAGLDWRKRYTIIEGIARGLLYLHRDSRLRIIHRDLKASNILLDEEMNPKISDFGMAKMFGRNESEASTSRVVGTYGYMAPEYAMEGLFSVKSDVYSFGILLLELVCGRRNSSFHSPEYSNIIQYAWDLWDGGRAMELIDPSIKSSYFQNEVMRCIHVAMLCVQDSASHRPNMSSVVLMLESENATILPMPRQPTFTSMRRSGDLEGLKTAGCNQDIPSSNDLTISSIIGR